MLISKFEDLPSESATILFGGSFNPPHIAHVLFTVMLHLLMPASRILVAPTWSHAFNKSLLPFDKRLKMLHSVFDDMPWVEVSTIERDLHESTSYTIDVVRALKKADPERRILVAIGADIVGTLHQWKAYDELEKLCDFLVLPRVGYHEEALPIASLPNVSSTAIRDAIDKDTPVARHFVRTFVPSSVLRIYREG